MRAEAVFSAPAICTDSQVITSRKIPPALRELTMQSQWAFAKQSVPHREHASTESSRTHISIFAYLVPCSRECCTGPENKRGGDLCVCVCGERGKLGSRV